MTKIQNNNSNLRRKSLNHIITPCHKSKCYYQSSVDSENAHQRTSYGINKCQ